jgi:mannose-6-phosphate isomerase-like protein (cupin superfamily)
VTGRNAQEASAKHDGSRQFGLSDALAAVQQLDSAPPSAIVFERGTVQVKMYQPGVADLQEPHERDELYIIARGSGWFRHGEQRHPFQRGDLLFVPAGTWHRFEQYTDDFCTWVIFYGPKGGERP